MLEVKILSIGVMNRNINRLPLKPINKRSNNRCIIKLKGIIATHKAMVKLNAIFSTDSFELRNFKSFLINKKMDNIFL